MNSVHFSSATDQWATPQALFDQLNAEFGPCTLDVCADETNAKCECHFDAFALEQDWSADPGAGDTGACWMNPPYGREIGKWVKKAATTRRRVVCLLPARTDTAWWHDFIWDAERDAPRPGVRVRLLRGRVKFGGAKSGAPFPSAVVVFDPPEAT